jgi:hypothetical protein
MKYCLNCGYPVADLYCGHCGQKSDPERINFTFLCREAFHFFTHLEKGFLFTTFQMVIHPGQTSKNFIDGKRKNYHSPISYFLIWTTIYIVFLLFIEKIFGGNTVIDYKNYFGPAAATRLAISNLSIVLTVVIPFQALYLFLLVTRKSYNYFETMVATIYSLGTIIQFQFVFALMALLYYGLNNRPVNLQISDVFKILYLIWFIFDTIRLYSLKHKIFRVIGFIALAFGTFTLWRLYGFPVFLKILL